MQGTSEGWHAKEKHMQQQLLLESHADLAVRLCTSSWAQLLVAPSRLQADGTRFQGTACPLAGWAPAASTDTLDVTQM